MFYSRTVRMILIFVNSIKMIYEPYKLEVQISYNVGNSIVEYGINWTYSQVKAYSAKNTTPFI